jgi:hypothetical protein
MLKGTPKSYEELFLNKLEEAQTIAGAAWNRFIDALVASAASRNVTVNTTKWLGYDTRSNSYKIPEPSQSHVTAT